MANSKFAAERREGSSPFRGTIENKEEVDQTVKSFGQPLLCFFGGVSPFLIGLLHKLIQNADIYIMNSRHFFSALGVGSILLISLTGCGGGSESTLSGSDAIDETKGIVSQMNEQTEKYNESFK